MYSPTIPRANIWKPPRKKSDIISPAQPVIVFPCIRPIITQISIKTLMKDIIIPATVINLSGLTLKEVIPSKAK